MTAVRQRIKHVLPPASPSSILPDPRAWSTSKPCHAFRRHVVSKTASMIASSKTATFVHRVAQDSPILPSHPSRPSLVRSSSQTPKVHHRHLHRDIALYSTMSPLAGNPVVHNVFEPTTGTWQYVVADPSTMRAAIIDPVLDFDPATQTITTDSANTLLSLVEEKGYSVDWILETHAHADHLTASFYLQTRLGKVQEEEPRVGIGKRIDQVQKLFGKRYMVPDREFTGVFDKLFEDNEKFAIGNMETVAIHLPGHTPDHLGYKIRDNVFCGDSIFHVDIGTARCDFPGGSVNALFKSGQKLLALPDQVKIWTGHDYPPAGRKLPVPYMTVKEHKEQNKHLRSGITEDEFVTLRRERDAALGAPRLLHQSLQINIRAGRLPDPTEAGHRLLHVPLKPQGLDW